MKTHIYILFAVIIFALSSCDNSSFRANLLMPLEQTPLSSDLAIMGVDFDKKMYQTDMEYQSEIKSKIIDFTRNNTNIFGKNILVLSLGNGNIETDDLPSLINHINNIESLCELQKVYKGCNFYSPIIESHLLLDSLIKSIENGYKDYDLDDENQYAQIETDIQNKLINIIQSKKEYSDLISIYNRSDINACIVEPIGTIGFRALGNNKNSFILGTTVNKFYDEEDAMISVPIDLYVKHHNSTYQEWIQLKNEYPNSTISITSTAYAPIALTRSLLDQIYTSGQVSNTDSEGKYTLEISYVSRYYQAAPYIIAECPITVRCFGGIKSKTHMNVGWDCHIGLLYTNLYNSILPWGGWRVHSDCRFADQLYTRSFSIPGLTVMAVHAEMMSYSGAPCGAGFQDIYVSADCWKDISVELNCPAR